MVYAIITMLILQQDWVLFLFDSLKSTFNITFETVVFFTHQRLLSSMFVIILTFLSRFTLLRCSVFKILTLSHLFDKKGMVGSSGLEPPTSRLSGVRSNHLSYEPM